MMKILGQDKFEIATTRGLYAPVILCALYGLYGCKGSFITVASTNTQSEATGTSEEEESETTVAPEKKSQLNTSVAKGLSLVFSSSELEYGTDDVTAKSIVYELLSKPAHGNLLLSGTTLGVGGTFTQKDVNDGKLSYVNTNSSAGSDTFTFSVRVGDTYADSASPDEPASYIIAISAVCDYYSSVTKYNDIGEGSEASPYRLCNLAQFQDLIIKGCGSMNTSCESHFLVEDDVDFSSISNWGSIGSGSFAFRGVFDGGEKTLSNISTDRAFFHWVSDATIKNINVDGLTISGTNGFTGFIGTLYSSDVENVHIQNGSNISTSTRIGILIGGTGNSTPRSTVTNVSVTGQGLSPDLRGSDYTGAIGYCRALDITNATADLNVDGLGDGTAVLCGELNNGSITRGVASGSVTSVGNNVGGLAGEVFNGDVHQSSSSASVTMTVHSTGGSKPTGGLIGSVELNSTISESFATGNVNSTDTALGGLIGGTTSSSSAVVIEDCYATGTVTSTDAQGGMVASVGGLVGQALAGTIRRSYATGNVSIPAGSTGIGGLLGYLGHWSVASTAAIENSFATGVILSGGLRGGLLGVNEERGGGTTSVDGNSYWDEDSSGEANMCGANYSASGCNDANGITSNATYFFQSSSTPLSNWNFSASGPWEINEGVSLPTLRWQSE